MQKRALVLLANGFEEIEGATIIDVLRRADVLVTLAAVGESKNVIGRSKIEVVADTLQKTTDYDALVLPGGLDAAQKFSEDAGAQRLIKAFYQQSKIVAAICASPLALHQAQIAKGARLTSYPAFKPKLSDFYDYQESDVVVDGNLITSRGPGTAFAFALCLVELLLDKGARDQVASAVLVK